MYDSDPIPAEDRVEQLLAELIERPEDAQGAALEELCAAHAELADRLRRRFSLFQRLREATPEPPSSAPERLGEFELIRELGRGGMGVVYLARQRRGDEERPIALKLVRDRGLFSPQARERLRREGAAAFRLDHPAICPVLDVGEVDDTPYVAMRYVPGESLAQRIRAARVRGAGSALDLPEPSGNESASGSGSHHSATGGRVAAILALGERVARALHAAHEAGLVHRDVKPGNVMVTPDGAPVLLDFGLVRDETADAERLTLSGQPLGTPAYMSPEQISPAGRAVDRTTDVYSLAATLYEAMTLRPPFEGRTREELFRSILSDNPPDPRRLAPGIGRDVKVVLDTALDKDPARRYATAQAFADDLRRARLAQPIVARPAGPVRRVRLWAQRNRLATAILALLLVAQIAIVALAIQAERRADDARVARARALRHFQSARDAVEELTRTAQEHLTDVPWLEPVRRELFEKALGFYREFLATRGDDPELRLAAVAVQLDAASLLSRLGELEDAEELTELARTAVLGLTGERIDGASRQLARVHLAAAKIADHRGDRARQARELQAAIGVARAESGRQPDSDEDRFALGEALRLLAELHVATGASDDARAAVDESLDVLGERDGIVALALERAVALRLSARLHRDTNDLPRAAADFTTAGGLLRSLLKRRPYDRRALASLAVNQLAYGVLLVRMRRIDDAETAYQDARQRFSVLARTFPDVPAYRSNVAQTLNNLANLAARRGDDEAAARLLRDSIRLFDELAAEYPGSPEHRALRARSRYNLGNRLRDGDPEESIEQYELALGTLETLVAEQPDVLRHRDLACNAAMNIGTLHAIRGDYDLAIPALAQAREYGNELLRRRPGHRRVGRTLGQLLFNEGTLHAERGDDDAAASRLREAIAHRSALSRSAPPTDRAHAELVMTWVRLAQVEDRRDPDGAARAWRDAAQAVADLPDAARDVVLADPQGRFDVTCVDAGRGASLLRAGDAAAGPLLERARDALDTDDDTRTRAVPQSVELLLCETHRALLHSRAGDDRTARDAAAAAVALTAQIDPGAIDSRLLEHRLRAGLELLETLTETLTDAEDQVEAVRGLRSALGTPR